MKIGNIVYCKKTLIYQNGIEMFSEEKPYYINLLDDNGIYISPYSPHEVEELRWEIKQHYGRWFATGTTIILYTDHFNDYFYSTSELRKLKLDKMNEK